MPFEVQGEMPFPVGVEYGGSGDAILGAIRVYRKNAVQVHALPPSSHHPQGPFPAHLFRESEIVYDYESAYPTDGSSEELGSTAQNKFKPIKWLYCGTCYERVNSDETADHICEIE